MILMMMKKKHKCTKSLIVDILSLLVSLGVPRVPSSWHRLKSLLMTNDDQQTNQKLVDQILYFCPQCEQQSTNSKKCNNVTCSYSIDTTIPPHKFMVINVQKQLEQILKSIDVDDINVTAVQSSESQLMRDVKDGQVYSDVIRSLENENHRLFLSLTCNVDGAAVYSSSEQTMWTMIGCINELQRSIRFKIDKVIGEMKKFCFIQLLFFILVFGISVGRKKPSRSIMQKMLNSIVTQLKALQRPNIYQVGNDHFEIFRVYLIGVCNDKPANSLVQNQAEPNAMFGCARCEIEGIAFEFHFSFSSFSSSSLF